MMEERVITTALVWGVVAVAVILGAPLALMIAKQRAKTRRLRHAREHAEALLLENRPEDALRVVEAVRKDSLDRRTREAWRRVEVSAFEQIKDVEALRDMV